jgi:hypothetical protein
MGSNWMHDHDRECLDTGGIASVADRPNDEKAGFGLQTKHAFANFSLPMAVLPNYYKEDITSIPS